MTLTLHRVGYREIVTKKVYRKCAMPMAGCRTREDFQAYEADTSLLRDFELVEVHTAVVPLTDDERLAMTEIVGDQEPDLDDEDEYGP